MPFCTKQAVAGNKISGVDVQTIIRSTSSGKTFADSRAFFPAWIAKDDDDAFNKYLECTDTVNCEGYNAPNNNFDIVSGAKEYSDHKGTTLIGTVKKEDEQDEDSLLEVAC